MSQQPTTPVLSGVLPPPSPNTPTTSHHTIDINKTTTTDGAPKEKGPTRERRMSKYKPPPKKSVTDGLQFAPLARHVVSANMYILLVLGIIDLAMTQRMKYLGPGIYAICVSALIYIWHFISDFNTQEKLEDSVEANLEPKGWPKWICVPLTLFANYLVQSILCLGLSVYLCFSPQTVLGGIAFVMASLIYLLGFIRREWPKPITGIV